MRFSATQLESFRLYCQADNEWMSEDDLLATIRGQFVPNEKVLLGQAFGAVCETPTRFVADGGYLITPRGGSVPVFFSDEMMREPLSWMDHQHGVFEAKTVQRYGRHDVVSVADQVVGSRLFEHKTTVGAFDPDKYIESCQWRFMVDAFEPSLVTYLTFELYIKQSARDGFVPSERGWWEPELRAVHAMNLYPYPGLHRDCAALVERFAAFVESRGLGWFLDRQQSVKDGGFEWAASM